MEVENRIDYNALIEEHSIISRTDLEGVITYVNHNFCEASGYLEDELIGKSHNIIRHPDVSKAFYEKLWQTIEKNQTWHGVFRNRDKEGHEYYANATIFPMLDATGEKVGYMSIHYLVTEDENIKHNLKKQVLVYKSEQIRKNRELLSHDIEMRKSIEKEFAEKYRQYIQTLDDELRRLRVTHKQDIVNVRSLEDELKKKKDVLDEFSLKSKKTIKTLSSERVELIQAVENLKKSNDSNKEKLEKAQESVVTFQGYIDEYRKKIDDLKDVIASYESDKNKEAQVTTSESTQSEEQEKSQDENVISQNENEQSKEEEKVQKS